jgi:hypothetical protein
VHVVSSKKENQCISFLQFLSDSYLLKFIIAHFKFVSAKWYVLEDIKHHKLCKNIVALKSNSVIQQSNELCEKRQKKLMIHDFYFVYIF